MSAMPERITVKCAPWVSETAAERIAALIANMTDVLSAEVAEQPSGWHASDD